MSKALLVTLSILLLSACMFQPTGKFAPTPTEADETVVTATPTSQLSASITPTSTPYKDNWLCFIVDVPAGWTTDGVSGGFASFTISGADQPSFNIASVSLGQTPTLEQALDELRRGSLGPYVQEVKDFVVDGQPALWATFAPEAEFQFVVMAIVPGCGDGPHALFISAAGADEKAFEMFLSHIRFFQ
ncbi:MAG TPA: hypothetical protein ENN99_00325 [Chloroflexi bacterium]|nr:hypothetical protein [Chloroflexota bacterium]